MRVYILSHSCGGPGIKGNIFIGRSRPDGTTQHSCAHVHTDYGEVKVYLVKRWKLWMALGGKEYVCLFFGSRVCLARTYPRQFRNDSLLSTWNVLTLHVSMSSSLNICKYLVDWVSSNWALEAANHQDLKADGGDGEAGGRGVLHITFIWHFWALQISLFGIFIFFCYAFNVDSRHPRTF